jgi:hypothetical protein
MKRALFVAAVFASSLASESALARNGGLYFELAPSWGFFMTDEVLVDDNEGDPVEYATASFVPALKVGVNILGWAGIEAHATGHYWDLDGDPGGGVYAGGVARITPLEILTYVLPDTVEIPSLIPAGPVKWKNRPFDIGVSFGGGYTLVGEDYAYQGGYFQWGFDVKFFITPNLAVGLDFPFRHLMYSPFRYADYGDRSGFCTDGGDAYGYIGDTKIEVEPNENRNVYKGVEIKSTEMASKCKDPAPEALFFAPALTIAGVFDFGI